MKDLPRPVSKVSANQTSQGYSVRRTCQVPPIGDWVGKSPFEPPFWTVYRGENFASASQQRSEFGPEPPFGLLERMDLFSPAA